SLLGGGDDEVKFGVSSESPFTGSRQTMVIARLDTLRIKCRNISSIRAENCEASLVDVEKINDDGSCSGIGFLEPVSLSWHRDYSVPVFEQSIGPDVTKLIYVLVAL